MVSVLIAGMLVFLLGGSLIRHFAVNEAEAIEQNFAEIRVYWAQMGTIAYVLSRARSEGDSGGINADPGDAIDDDVKVIKIIDYFDELTSGDPNGYQWNYQLQSGYYFFTQLAIEDNPLPLDSSDGRLTMTISLNADQTGDNAGLVAIENRVKDLRNDFCMGDQAALENLVIPDGCDINNNEYPDVATGEGDCCDGDPSNLCGDSDSKEDSDICGAAVVNNSDGVSRIERIFYQ